MKKNDKKLLKTRCKGAGKIENCLNLFSGFMGLNVLFVKWTGLE